MCADIHDGQEHKRSVQGPDTEAQDQSSPNHHIRLATHGRSAAVQALQRDHIRLASRRFVQRRQDRGKPLLYLGAPNRNIRAGSSKSLRNALPMSPEPPVTNATFLLRSMALPRFCQISRHERRCLCLSLVREISVDEGDRHAAFSDSRRDPLDQAQSHISAGKNTRHACFKQIGVAIG